MPTLMHTPHCAVVSSFQVCFSLSLASSQTHTHTHTHKPPLHTHTPTDSDSDPPSLKVSPFQARFSYSTRAMRRLHQRRHVYVCAFVCVREGARARETYLTRQRKEGGLGPVLVCVCVCVCVRACVCVCVCERNIPGIAAEGGGVGDSSACVCMCVYERERERERGNIP